jgi:hypothetical protein
MRVITDPAERALPSSAVAAMRPNGTTNIGAMIRSVLMRPRELPALLQTACDALAARATLMRGRHLLAPVLLHVDSRGGEPVTANEPYLTSAMQAAPKQPPWRMSNGPRCCTPDTIAEFNGSLKSQPSKGPIPWRQCELKGRKGRFH